MQELTQDQFAQEMKVFEGLCNKAQIDLQSYIDGCEDLQLKEKLQNRYTDFERCVNYIVSNTGFINAPASTRYHLSIPHGLLIHSNSVTKTMMKLNNALNCEIPLYKIITAGLFHDLGKHDDYIENQPTEKQKAAGYKANPPYLFSEQEINPHESESLYILQKYLDMDEDEWLAILYHNSPYDKVEKVNFKQNMLMTILQYSDYWSTLYLEAR